MTDIHFAKGQKRELRKQQGIGVRICAGPVSVYTYMQTQLPFWDGTAVVRYLPY